MNEKYTVYEVVVFSLLLIIVITASGCGKQVDSEFQEYVEGFEQDSITYNNEQHIDYSVQFGDVDVGGGGDTEAYCHRSLLGRNVVVDKAKWDAVDGETRKVIMYHEFGHCSLNREHDDSTFVSNYTYTVPNSLMNSHTLTGLAFDSLKEHYLEELFK